MAWIEQDEGSSDTSIWHQRFGFDGNPAGVAAQVGRANKGTWNLNAAVQGDRFVVVYDAALGTRTHELHMITIGDGAALHQQLSEDDGFASLYPDIQFSPAGQVALTWIDERDGNQEVYLFTGAAEALAAGKTASGRRITNTSGSSIGAYLAWNSEVIGLAWSDQTEKQRDIFVQQFTADGEPLAPAHPVEPSSEEAGVPAVRAVRNGFLIAWNDYVIAGEGGHMNMASSKPRYAQIPLDR